MRNKKSTTNPTKDHEPKNSEINGKVINVLGEVLGLASCHKRSNHCRYVKGTSPFDITVTSGRLRWHRNQSHTCAPCINIKIRKGEDRRKKKREVLHLFRWYTHTETQRHAYMHACMQTDRQTDTDRWIDGQTDTYTHIIHLIHT